MNIWSRIKMAGGIAGVLCVLAGLTVLVNHNLSFAHDTSATLVAEEVPVGTDYAGTLVEQRVKSGDRVRAGQELFSVRSNTLQYDVNAGYVQPDQSTYTIRDNNTLVLKAAADGIVIGMDYSEGSFVPANSIVASILKDNSIYLEAHYRLSPPDYARLRTGAEVLITLPNNQEVQARVVDIAVSSVDGDAATIVRAQGESVANNGMFDAGTPVRSRLTLDNTGAVTSLVNQVSALLQPASR